MPAEELKDKSPSSADAVSEEESADSRDSDGERGCESALWKDLSVLSLASSADGFGSIV